MSPTGEPLAQNLAHRHSPACCRLQALQVSALRYPADYLRVDWWDRREGPLPNPDVTYPKLARAAAFACTGNACSLPVFDPRQIALAVDRLRAPQGPAK